MAILTSPVTADLLNGTDAAGQIIVLGGDDTLDGAADNDAFFAGGSDYPPGAESTAGDSTWAAPDPAAGIAVAVTGAEATQPVDAGSQALAVDEGLAGPAGPDTFDAGAGACPIAGDGWVGTGDSRICEWNDAGYVKDGVVIGGYPDAGDGTIAIDDVVPGEYDGVGNYDDTGYSISSAGDINGDGFDDFLVEGSGYSYVMYGYGAGDASYDGDDYTIAGDADSDYSGYYISAAGDVNGDGFEDYVVQGYGYSYTVYGYASTDADAYAGDGFENVVVGDYGGGAYDSGAPYVVYVGDVRGGPVHIEVSGDGWLVWTEGDEIFASGSGDGQVTIATGGDVVTLDSGGGAYAGDSAQISLRGATLSVASALGEPAITLVDV